MRAVEYLVRSLMDHGVADVYGIPGGVMLDFLYCVNDTSGIEAHLCYHEQGAAFAACGYSQVHHGLGVAYATRGPGFTNLVTAIADAYADSIPVLFLTAHTGRHPLQGSSRFEVDQEIDAIRMVGGITKYAASIDSPEIAANQIDEAIDAALSGRKGPVLLDFSVGVWNVEIEPIARTERQSKGVGNEETALKHIRGILDCASKPVIVFGDGIQQAGAVQKAAAFASAVGAPVLTSRCAQDVGSACVNYFGYVGSHGIRYANRILAEADAIIALGNRMAFPPDSKSFRMALSNKPVVMVDVDEAEVQKAASRFTAVCADAGEVLDLLNAETFDLERYSSWLSTCVQMREDLESADVNDAVECIANTLRCVPPDWPVVADVGNNEFWLSRGYELAHAENRVLYSKSFGALGCGLAKAIGVCHRTGSPTMCVTGDQGFQLNLQELRVVSAEQLPLATLVVNNQSSGMIKDQQQRRFDGRTVHTTPDDGYFPPDLGALAQAYGLQYALVGVEGIYDTWKSADFAPMVFEVAIDRSVGLEPHLPKGADIRDMSPSLNNLDAAGSGETW